MPITFNTIPSNIRKPGVYFENDNSRANLGLSQFLTRLVVFGQRLSTGTVAALTMTLVSSGQQAASFFGQGSELANMIKAIKDNAPGLEVWAIPLDDNGAGVAATGTLTLAGTATANGTHYLYIGGVLVTSAVLSGDTPTVQGAALAAAVNANANLPVTAANVNGVITFTAKNKGLNGNDIDIRVNYRGIANGEQAPAGTTQTIVAMSSGATNPVLQTALDVLPEEVYDYFVCPYTDSTNLTALEAELSRRWGGLVMLEGHAFIGKRDTVGNLTTFGTGRNSQHVTCVGFYDSPTHPRNAAAMVAAQVAASVSADPALPPRGLELVGFQPSPVVSRLTQAEQNTLLFSGVSPLVQTRDGRTLTDRIITMYQTSNVNTPDPSYLDITTLATLSYMRQDWLSYSGPRYERMKIADDGTRITAGANITTPKYIKADYIGRARQWEAVGLIENLDQFANDIIVERDAHDPTRVNIQPHPDLVNPLYTLAISNQFIV